MASSKSSATIGDLFLIFNLLFFTFGTSFQIIHPHQPTPVATPPRSVQPGSGGYAPPPTPVNPAPGNGGHGVPIPHPMTPPASPPSGNGGHGVPIPHPMSPPASPPSGNGGHGVPIPHPMAPPASPPSGNGGHGVPIPHPMAPPASPPSGNGGHGATPPPRPTPPARPPSGNGGQCQKELVSLNVCANVLGVSLNGPCCSLIKDLVALEASVCLCAAFKAGLLGVLTLDINVAISVILSSCGKSVPLGYHC